MNIGHHRKAHRRDGNGISDHDDGYNLEARNDDADELELGKGNTDSENRERGNNNNGKAFGFGKHTPHRAANTKIQLHRVRSGMWAIIAVATISFVPIWLRLYSLSWTGGRDVASMENFMSSQPQQSKQTTGGQDIASMEDLQSLQPPIQTVLNDSLTPLDKELVNSNSTFKTMKHNDAILSLQNLAKVEKADSTKNESLVARVQQPLKISHKNAEEDEGRKTTTLSKTLYETVTDEPLTQQGVRDKVNTKDGINVAEGKNKILYIIRSFQGRYKSHLSLQARSWMHNLHPDNEAVLVASQYSPEEVVTRQEAMFSVLPDGLKRTFSTPKCEQNNHGMGLCCQEANALVTASSDQEFQSFDWVFVIDEDVFVSPAILREIVLEYNASSLISVGTKGCGAKGVGGYCGGGGYLISRPALERTVGSPHFMLKYQNLCNKTQYCDIVTASMLESANTTLLTDHRFHPWGMRATNRFSNKTILSQESDREVAHRLIEHQHAFSQMQARLLNTEQLDTKETNITLIPKSEMFSHLLEHPDILRAIVSHVVFVP